MMSNIHSEIVIRKARSADGEALTRLAQRDSAPLPAGPLLVAEVDGELRAAVSLEGDGAIADPFHPTSDLLALLELRADQVRRSRRRRARVAARTPVPVPAT